MIVMPSGPVLGHSSSTGVHDVSVSLGSSRMTALIPTPYTGPLARSLG